MKTQRPAWPIQFRAAAFGVALVALLPVSAVAADAIRIGHVAALSPREALAPALPRRSDLQPPPSLCGRGQLSGHPAMVVAMMYPDGEKWEN